ENGLLMDDFITIPPAPITTINDLALGNYIHTCSCVFRNRGVMIFGPNFKECPLGDYYMHMMNAQHGNIYYVDSVMAVYRIHNDSLWSSQAKFDNLLKTLVAQKYISKDLIGSHTLANMNIIDSSINIALEVKNMSRGHIINVENLTFNREKYSNRLLERLLDSNKEIERLNAEIKNFIQLNDSVRFLLLRIFVNCKSRLNKYTAAKAHKHLLSWINRKFSRENGTSPSTLNPK
ncbi:hypothetical protein KBY71_04620, partial [Cyanobium sp. T1B-Tous]|uniref:hypothetical protein n=1 Tax=Cyanobium sp. T1B-Tous TaxID=2823721 RepID=UPI0020CDBEDC